MGKRSSELHHLRTLVDRLQREVRQQRALIDRLVQENQQLREQLEQSQRANARQAAPFRRREATKKSEAEKKPPGRKSGHRGHYRPRPEQVDDEQQVPLEGCPDCGGPVSQVRAVEQFIEEIPPVRPRVIRIVTYRGRCRRCGPVESTHPLQRSRARGAAGTHLGRRALGVLGWLNKHLGLTLRKTCRVAETLFGLRLTPGGLSQALDGVADRLQGAYAQLHRDLRAAPAVHADETSWWVGGPGWWLWTFTTPRETLYRVDASRGSAVVADVLGEDFAGMLASDCLSSYDPIDCRKHKCTAHHLRAIAQARDRPDQHDNHYLLQWTVLFKMVGAAHRMACQGRLDAQQLAGVRGRLQDRLDRLLQRPCTQSGDVAIRNRLAKQRPHLLGCLYELAAEPTNNRAERALRPAVIARKLSCGNKTDRGRRTWQILVSLAQTCRQRGQDFLAYVAQHMALQPTSR
jgi:transposase